VPAPTLERPPPVTTPVAPPATALPLPAAPPPAPPPVSAPAATPPEAPARPPSPEAEVTELLARYKSALEARDLGALQRIWPSLSGTPESRLRSEFEHASRISVEIVDPRIAVSGITGTVNFLRRYLVITTEGKPLQNDTRATMEIRRTGTAWAIERIRFETAR
jgi:hypothetical protein